MKLNGLKGARRKRPLLFLFQRLSRSRLALDAGFEKKIMIGMGKSRVRHNGSSGKTAFGETTSPAVFSVARSRQKRRESALRRRAPGSDVSRRFALFPLYALICGRSSFPLPILIFSRPLIRISASVYVLCQRAGRRNGGFLFSCAEGLRRRVPGVVFT